MISPTRLGMLLMQTEQSRKLDASLNAGANPTMLAIVSVYESIAIVMNSHRKVFCRKEGKEHVSRYVTGLITSPNRTLQGICDWQVYDEPSPSRRG